MQIPIMIPVLTTRGGINMIMNLSPLFKATKPAMVHKTRNQKDIQLILFKNFWLNLSFNSIRKVHTSPNNPAKSAIPIRETIDSKEGLVSSETEI